MSLFFFFITFFIFFLKMETIPFEIAHCSSFEQDYEPEQLLISSPRDNQDPFHNVNHRGWQTKRYIIIYGRGKKRRKIKFFFFFFY